MNIGGFVVAAVSFHTRLNESTIYHVASVRCYSIQFVSCGCIVVTRADSLQYITQMKFIHLHYCVWSVFIDV